MHALDYLLKPFDRERFQQALARARDQLERKSTGDLERRLLQLVQDLKPARQPMERFVVKTGGRVFFVRAEEIEWIEAAGNYVKLHVGSDAHLFRETMNAIEAKLDPDLFYRLHRSHIVNIERVRELQPWFNGEYVVFLRSGTRLTLSRGYRKKLQAHRATAVRPHLTVSRAAPLRLGRPPGVEPRDRVGHLVKPADTPIAPSRRPFATSTRSTPSPVTESRRPAPASTWPRESKPSSPRAARARSTNSAGASRTKGR